MEEVNRFVEDMGLDAVVPSAAWRVFARSYKAGISDAFPHAPEAFREVIEYLERQATGAPPHETM
jgi:phage-related baseplate assembly protein